jgi:hypothetical protein
VTSHPSGLAGTAMVSVALGACVGGPQQEPPPAPARAAAASPTEAAQRLAAQAAPRWQERFERLPADWDSPSGASASDLGRVLSLGHEAGGSFLHACHDASSERPPPAVHFGRSFRRPPLRLDQACVLSWRWRVLRHPVRGDDPWADVAASVYVITTLPGIFTRGRGFKLAWLSRPGPEGTHQRGLLQLALRVAPASPAWRAERVDLCALFRKHFGAIGDEPLAYVGVVTDADDSRSIAEADYDDFVLRRR